MHSSTITAKGQTTIPKQIRDSLHLKPHDTIIYVFDGMRVFLAPVKGTILDLKGTIKRTRKKPIDFHKLREKMKEKVAKDVTEQMK